MEDVSQCFNTPTRHMPCFVVDNDRETSVNHESMEEREGWRAAMDRWEQWKGGGYSTYDATIIEGLCLSLDENPIVVDGQPLNTCWAIGDAIHAAIDSRAKFRTAKGALNYVSKCIDTARDERRLPSERPGASAYAKRPRTQADERRKLGRDAGADQRRHPPKF